MTAGRMERVERSKLLDLIVLGQRMRKEGVNFVDLGPGQPDFPVPGEIVEATAQALRDGHTYYSPVMGMPELREAVAQRYSRLYGARYASDNVMITAGAKGALYHVIGAHLDEGCEVVVPSPYYVSTPEIVKLWGGTPRFVDCRIESGFLPRLEDLDAAAGPAARGLVLNSPCNPTGAVIPRALLKDVLAWAKRRGLFVILDECYDRYVYPPAQYATLAHADLDPELPFFIAGSFSKTFSMTGYRLGWAIGPKKGIAAAGLIQSHSMNGATTFAQFGGLKGIREEDRLFAPVLELFALRRKALLEELAGVPGLRCPEPDGAFYAFPDASGLMERVGVKDTDALAQALLRDHGVMVVPGGTLGMEGHLRISYAVEESLIREAAARIRKAAGA
jgi:aspartate aminotransferase